MEQAAMLKQIINFNKTIFNNAFNAMTMLQEQIGKMTNMSLPMWSGIWMMPGDGRKFVDEYVKIYQKGCRDFKNAVDENFKKAEEFFAGPVKERENATKNTTEKKPAPKNAGEKENVTKK